MAELTVTASDGRKLVFDIDLFENQETIDLNVLLRIDYNNILAEKITFPIVITRFGTLLAEVERELRQEELNYSIWKGKQKAKIREKWDNDKERPVVRGAKYTKDEVEDELRQTKAYRRKKELLNKLEFEKDTYNTLYWGAKEKLDRLNNIDYPIEAKKASKVKEFNGIIIKQK